MSDKKMLPKFTPEGGNTYVIKLDYDKPIEGEGNYGKYHRYQVTVWKSAQEYKHSHASGEKFAWFPNEKIHFAIERLGFGRETVFALEVGFKQGPRGPYNTYTIIDNKNVKHDVDEINRTDPGNDFPDEMPPDDSNDESLPFDDNYPEESPQEKFTEDTCFGTMARCYIAALDTVRPALELQSSDIRPTPEDVRAIAITMYISLTNH